MTFNRDTFGFDISYYQGAVDFAKMQAYGTKFVILRCGYGVVKDTQFDNYMAGVNGLLPVSVYHYYEPDRHPLDQANKVLATLLLYKSRIRRVWLDLEFYWTGAYSDPKYWKVYRDAIKNAGYQVGWYTRATWWDSRVASYAAEFATDPLWAAQYNTALTLIPKGWTKAMLWQDGTPSVGIAAGVSSKEIDHDIWNDDFDFVTEWGTNVPLPPVDVTTHPYNGMTRISGFRNGWYFELFKLDPRKFRFELVSTPTLETVPSVAGRKGALLATNAGEWVRETLKPQDWTVSNGAEIVVRDTKAARPSLQIGDGWVMIDHLNETGAQQAFTGLRYLISQSTLQPYLFGNESQYVEGHARTCFGQDSDGNVMILLSEGVYPNQGLKLSEAAQILQQYGAVIAFDGGGGGDSGGVLNGKSLIKPENIVNGANVYRALPMTFCIYGVETMADYYKITAIDANNHTIRADKVVSAGAVGSFKAGDVLKAGVTAEDVYVYSENVPLLTGTTAWKGDKWRKVYDKNGAAVVGWTAEIHRGVLQGIKVELVAEAPPPVTGDVAIDMTLKADGTITGSWTNI